MIIATRVSIPRWRPSHTAVKIIMTSLIKRAGKSQDSSILIRSSDKILIKHHGYFLLVVTSIPIVLHITHIK